MSDVKAKIRKGTLLNRRIVKSEIFADRVSKVQQHLLAFIKEKEIKSCHVFLPINRNKEFDTWDLVKNLRQQKIQVVISVSDFNTFEMAHFIYEESVKFEANKFDIPEPINAQLADISKIEMILVPLLAADKKGSRIGYGKGFYDRLLSKMPKNVLKIGVNLAPLFDQFDFAEAHDVRLDYCVTPHEIYNCHD